LTRCARGLIQFMERAMSNAVATIDVEVAYALPEKQFLLRLTVPENTTAMKAIELSGLMQTYPDLDVSKVGIFSQLLGVKGLPDPCSYQLAHLDRVEIYRPLLLDPMEIRRRRARQAARSKTK